MSKTTNNAREFQRALLESFQGKKPSSFTAVVPGTSAARTATPPKGAAASKGGPTSRKGSRASSPSKGAVAASGANATCGISGVRQFECKGDTLFSNDKLRYGMDMLQLKGTPADKGLDDHIESAYKANLGDESKRTTPSHITGYHINLRDFMKIPAEDHRDEDAVRLHQMRRIESGSGGVNDCLIHSFLTCVSPAFRRLSGDHKTEVASSFRRCLLIRLLTQGCVIASLKQEFELKDSDINASKRLLQSQAYLVNETIELLSKMFHIPILVLEGEKRGALGSETANMPPSSYLYGEDFKDTSGRDKSAIIIANIGNNHFEAVKYDDSYMISNEDATSVNKFIKSFQRAFYAAKANLGQCFEEGTRVLADGKLGVVEGRRFDDRQQCESYDVLLSDGTGTKRFSAAKVTAAPRGGSRKARRRSSRKTRRRQARR